MPSKACQWLWHEVLEPVNMCYRWTLGQPGTVLHSRLWLLTVLCFVCKLVYIMFLVGWLMFVMGVSAVSALFSAVWLQTWAEWLSADLFGGNLQAEMCICCSCTTEMHRWLHRGDECWLQCYVYVCTYVNQKLIIKSSLLLEFWYNVVGKWSQKLLQL